MTPFLTNSAKNDRRPCSNRENWNPCTTYIYYVLCNSLLWTKCRNLGKCQIGPMAIQTNLEFWKLYAKSINFVQCWFYEPHNELDYPADNMQHQHLQSPDHVNLSLNGKVFLAHIAKALKVVFFIRHIIFFPWILYISMIFSTLGKEHWSTWSGIFWDIFLILKPIKIAKRPYDIICRSIKVMHFCQIIWAWLNIRACHAHLKFQM